jgi:replicative DNA helicase
LRSKARRQAALHQIDLIIVDYLQLMQGIGDPNNRQEAVAGISQAIKGIARELRVPVLALSQLNREAEKDDVGMPKLAHLRESGAIEQDADVVMILSRPPKHEAEEKPNLIRVHVAKQRNGPTGIVEMLFDRETQRFRNLAEGRAAREAPPPSLDPDLDVDDGAGLGDDEIPF